MVFAHELRGGNQTGLFVAHSDFTLADITCCQLFAHHGSLKNMNTR